MSVYSPVPKSGISPMPLYQYAPRSGHCDRCHGRCEVFQRAAGPETLVKRTKRE